MPRGHHRHGPTHCPVCGSTGCWQIVKEPKKGLIIVETVAYAVITLAVVIVSLCLQWYVVAIGAFVGLTVAFVILRLIQHKNECDVICKKVCKNCGYKMDLF